MTQKLTRAKQEGKAVFSPFIGIAAVLIPLGNLLPPMVMAIAIFIIFASPSLIILNSKDRKIFASSAVVLLIFVYLANLILEFEKSQVIAGLVLGLAFMLAAVLKSRRY
ncbi:hypothetical protein [Microbulbifer sp. SAOS-129_SWC]|uniref:hypothetical protein n=1 Tax=Microbulbifer sp. SAOS-129_SWC TaxID=3145235 RepID=UPI00321719C2